MKIISQKKLVLIFFRGTSAGSGYKLLFERTGFGLIALATRLYNRLVASASYCRKLSAYAMAFRLALRTASRWGKTHETTVRSSAPADSLGQCWAKTSPRPFNLSSEHPLRHPVGRNTLVVRTFSVDPGTKDQLSGRITDIIKCGIQVKQILNSGNLLFIYIC
jgi:hypothetical protein